MGCTDSKGALLVENTGTGEASMPQTEQSNKKTDNGEHLDATAQRASVGGTNDPASNDKELGKGIKIDTGMFVTQQHHHLADRYTRERKLGDGAYGEVLLCKDKITGAERAVKIIKKGDKESDAAQIRNEVELVKLLDHPNIMKIYEFFEDRRNFYMVMECYTGGELFDEIVNRQRFTELDAASIMEQCLLGLTYLHSKNIVHRDLKPENLLLESKDADAQIKIVDFGLSTLFKPETKMAQRYGTAYYIAPEVIRKKYDEKCDIWSLGVIMYILLCGYPPFGGETDQEILKKVESGKYEFDPQEWSSISSEAKDLIKKMLFFNPNKRASAAQCLKHPWILKKSKIGNIQENKAAQGALSNMRKFYSNQKLAQAALLFMGSKLTTMEETKELTKIFRQLDADGNGRLDRKELIDGYKLLVNHKGGGEMLMSREDIEAEVDAILKAIDFDQNGYIEFSEFVTVAMSRTQLLTKERLQAAFNLFDQDGSGAIASEELRGLLGDVDDETWQAILKEVDSNGDGEVDFSEFETMMLKLVERTSL